MSRDAHVVLIGVDGLQLERLWDLLPTCGSDGYNKFPLILPSYTGGVTGTPIQQDTMSGPGWATILTGVWSWKHQVHSNSKANRATSTYPSIFHLLSNGYRLRPDSSFKTPPRLFSWTAWPNIHAHFKLQESGVMSEFADVEDHIAIDRAVDIILHDENPQFMFLHLDAVDSTGHARCFGTAYDQAVLGTDMLIARVLTAIEQRVGKTKNSPPVSSLATETTSRTTTTTGEECVPSDATQESSVTTPHDTRTEEWMVVLVTDHGRDSMGWNHGYQTSTEKRTFAGFWFCNVPDAPTLLQRMLRRYEQGGRFHDSLKKTLHPFESMYRCLSQAAITPTILDFMGVPLSKDWHFDARSYLSDPEFPHPIDCVFPYKNCIYWGVVDGVRMLSESSTADNASVSLQNASSQNTKQFTGIPRASFFCCDTAAVSHNDIIISPTAEMLRSEPPMFCLQDSVNSEMLMVTIEVYEGSDMVFKDQVQYAAGRWVPSRLPGPGVVWNIKLVGPGEGFCWTRLGDDAACFRYR